MKDNQRIASRALSGRSLLLSLFQLMAVMTSLGAALTVLQTLFLPPLGRSGLEESCLPALVLVIALWFCCRGTVARLGSYAVVASLLALSFYAQYFSRHDRLFGHTPGPPQLFVATGIASTIGILAGIGWFVSKRRWAKQIVTAPAVSQSRGWRAAHWLVDSAIVVLTLLSALLAVLTIPNLITDPLIGKKLDDYAEQRLRFGRHSIRELAEQISDTRSPKRAQMAELMANRQVQPGDEAAISVLKTLAIDDDPRVRRAATVTLRHLIADAQNTGQQSSVNPAAEAAWVRGLNDQDELVQWQAALAVLEQNDVQSDRNTRLSAITILGRAQDRESVDQAVPALLRVIEESRDDACRRAAIQSLGRIGPAISVGWSNAGNQAIFRLALELERPGVSERKLAAEALAAMGPAANAAVPSFGRAWEKQLLTLNDAQLLYLIDPEAAEKLQIARPNAPPQQ